MQNEHCHLRWHSQWWSHFPLLSFLASLKTAAAVLWNRQQDFLFTWSISMSMRTAVSWPCVVVAVQSAKPGGPPLSDLEELSELPELVR